MRNKLYDCGWIRTVRYDDLCVISVGNITAGGTGKTPFVEYIVRSLSRNGRIAVLSRGYRRSTKGFRFVDEHATPGEAGDEPCQIKHKFPDLIVAVDADRVRGIANIRKATPDVRVILLDDAFQYRRIKPALSILLADYNRPLYRDSMLPGGRLREWSCFARRADVMVVTKSPAGISREEQQTIARRYARIFPHGLFFTSVGYGEPLPVFVACALSTADLSRYDVLLITGIACPQPFEAYIRKHSASVHSITFPDHHAFSGKDIKHIVHVWESLASTSKLLLTTEKDSVRLRQTGISPALAQHSYYIPIEVHFAGEENKNLEQKLHACVYSGSGLPAAGSIQ